MSGKKFRFSLQSVLDLREYESESARHALSHAVRARREQEQKIERMEERLDELNRKAPDPGQADLRTLRRFDAFRSHLRHQCDRARKKLAALRDDEQAARDAWMEKRQNEERLHTLREQEESAHRQDVTASNIDFMDEQAVLRFNRTNRSTLL